MFPLLKNKPELVNKAKEFFTEIKKEIRPIIFDDNGNIGKRYRRQDEIGTPFCVTIDFDTLENDTVTVRDRDTGKQERVKIGELTTRLKKGYLIKSMINFEKKVLGNGLRVILAPMNNTEAVTLLVLVGVGSRYETKKSTASLIFWSICFSKAPKSTGTGASQ